MLSKKKKKKPGQRCAGRGECYVLYGVAGEGTSHGELRPGGESGMWGSVFPPAGTANAKALPEKSVFAFGGTQGVSSRSVVGCGRGRKRETGLLLMRVTWFTRSSKCSVSEKPN